MREYYNNDVWNNLTNEQLTELCNEILAHKFMDSWSDWTRLGYCQAQYTERYKHESFDNMTSEVLYKVLVSYTTVVAIELWNGNNGGKVYNIELGKWSRTTSKQVTRWCGYNRILLNGVHTVRFYGGVNY